MQLELFVGELAPFLGQQLLYGKKVQGVGFSQGAIEVEQQSFEHESSIPYQGLPQCSSDQDKFRDLQQYPLVEEGLAII